MLEREVTICNRLGLHARAAARLVRTASRFDADVRLGRADRSAIADAKSILNVLLLAAGRGTQLQLTTDGADEAAAMEAICELFADGFGEEAELGRDRTAARHDGE